MKLIPLVAFGAVLLAGGYAAWSFTRSQDKPAPPPAPVPVTAARAVARDVPVYLGTIGSVRALNSVELHPQVGGVLLDIGVQEGDAVTKGQVLAVIDPRPFKAALDKAQAQLTQDQAQLDNATLDQKRYSQLAARDFASRQQLDTQTANVGRLQGVVAADRAAIDEAEINLGYTVLKSPLDGRVGLRRVDPGNLLQANSTGPGILSVVQEQPISVIFSLPETDLPRIRDAMRRSPPPVLADAPEGGRSLGQGVLVTTDNSVDQSSGTIQLRANFDNADRALTPGQFVDIRLQVDVASGVTVPHAAVQHAQQGLFVFGIAPDKTAKRQEIALAYDDGAVAVLAKGVDAGTDVVIAGQSRIGNGTKLSFAEPDAPAGDAPPPGRAER